MIALLVMGLALSSALIVSVEASGRSQKHVNWDVEQTRLADTADSVITVTADHLWKRFLVYQEGAPPSMLAVKTYLDARGFTATVPPATAGSTTAPTPGPAHSLLEMGIAAEIGFPVSQADTPTWGGLHILDLDMERQDTGSGVVLTFMARISSTTRDDLAHTWRMKQSFSLAKAPFKGLGFALLSNNVNCIMCHADIRTTDMYYNQDPSLYGTFEAAKVGALESLLIRPDKAMSSVAGQFFTRGVIMNKSGTILPNLNGTTLTGFAFDGDGNIIQDANGNMTSVPLQVIDETGITGSEAVLPESFPSVIPDGNGNKMVDPEEFAIVAGNSFGSITGGIQVSVGASGSYGGSGMPTASNTGGTISGTHTGNLVLYGTEANPIILNGSIAVDGDIAIAGVIKGSGELVASNNVYILGPIIYADGTTTIGSSTEATRTFGVGADGTINQLAIGAGGNVLVGDYLSEKKNTGTAITGTNTGGFNFTMSEITLFNRMEWTRTQTTLPGANGTTVNNPLYQAGYTPRYYTVNAGDPVYLFVGSGAYFDPVMKSWLGKEHLGNWNDPTTYMTLNPTDPSYASAVISPLSPTSNWLNTSELYAMWNQMETEYGGQAFEIDSMLYTNNSIMSLARKSSAWRGQMVVNGGIVAADTGILVPGPDKLTVGLNMNYDARLARAFDLRTDEGVTLVRLLSH